MSFQMFIPKLKSLIQVIQYLKKYPMNQLFLQELEQILTCSYIEVLEVQVNQKLKC